MAECLLHCHTLYPVKSMANNGPVFGCAHVHPHDNEAVLAVAAWGLPDPCKLHDGRHYVAWAESACAIERVRFKLIRNGETVYGHYHGKNICWVKMYVTIEHDKKPRHPSSHVVLSTRMPEYAGEYAR